MFDLDEFVVHCEGALTESEPRRAIREVLVRAMSEPSKVGDALQPTEGGLTLLHHAEDLTILHVVWAPGMKIYPHDHRMWAAIGIYSGQEDNEFFRRSGSGERTLVESGGKVLTVGDTAILGDATIHAVSNTGSRLTGAIHVYGGDFVNQPRSQWGPGLAEEQPFDLDEARRQFEAANDAWQEMRE
jgi:predicted metal-dependent enzyme (double-stranded beta helix superfamily)